MPESRTAESWPANSRLLATIGHDLKAPLVTVQGFVSGLEVAARAGNWSQFTADVGRINRTCEHLRSMLDQLLDLARDGHSPLVIEPVPLAEVVQSALDLLASPIQQRSATITVGPNLPRVLGDRLRLVRVLQNLLENALKSPAQPKIEIAALWEGALIRVEVRDQGRGLAPSDRARVFELYRRVDPQSPGYGLGLWIVKQIVEALGGQVGMESPGLDQGATAWFTIPAAS